MRTIAIYELESSFPAGFSRDILRCLPVGVAKLILNPHDSYFNTTFNLPKESMIFYVADKIDIDDVAAAKPKMYFIDGHTEWKGVVEVMSHLSKFVLISSSEIDAKEVIRNFSKFLNFIQIYVQDHKIKVRSFHRTQNFTNVLSVLPIENANQENLSQILFPDKIKNLKGFPLYVAFYDQGDGTDFSKGWVEPISTWTKYFHAVSQTLNATLNYVQIPVILSSQGEFFLSLIKGVAKLTKSDQLDFLSYYYQGKTDLESYRYEEACYLVPLPPKYSIMELILFLPLDNACWMWLGISVVISTFLWKAIEGHWNFLFGAFAYFVGQSAEIRTSRQTLKIILQVFIFTLFVFSNGYQSIVTSFMLEPEKQPLCKTVNELLKNENYKIEFNPMVEEDNRENENYQNAKANGRILLRDYSFGNTLFNNSKDFAPLAFCKLKDNMGKYGDGKSMRGMYLIPEVATLLRRDVYVTPKHPLIEKFQKIMDMSFEAGLPSAWDKYYVRKFSERKALLNGFEIERKLIEKDILEFNDILPFFLILAFGFAGALISLFVEIFHADFLSQLSKEFFERKYKEIFKRQLKTRPKMQKKGRIIIVKPVP